MLLLPKVKCIYISIYDAYVFTYMYVLSKKQKFD